MESGSVVWWTEIVTDSLPKLRREWQVLEKPGREGLKYQILGAEEEIMTRWTPKFEIMTVPDDVLFTESARRQRARQIDPPRPKVLRQCPHCFQPFGAREMRKHLPACPNRSNPIQSERAGWTVQKVTDPGEQDARTYRYWQSLPAGERIIATWQLTEAAYSIQKVG